MRSDSLDWRTHTPTLAATQGLSPGRQSDREASHWERWAALAAWQRRAYQIQAFTSKWVADPEVHVLRYPTSPLHLSARIEPPHSDWLNNSLYSVPRCKTDLCSSPHSFSHHLFFFFKVFSLSLSLSLWCWITSNSLKWTEGRNLTLILKHRLYALTHKADLKETYFAFFPSVFISPSLWRVQ